MKKLAYPIQKKSTGFYQLIEFKAEPAVIEKLEVNYRRDERVIRFLTFKMDKYAAEYAAKRRNVEMLNQLKRRKINHGTATIRNQIFNSAISRC